MTTDATYHSPRSLSPRHGRFVAEYLKDGNATEATSRAGYWPRGAQPSASRLQRDPRIEAALAEGRQRIAREYAKIADFADGRLRVDLDKASLAQQAGILELRIADHRNGEQRVTLKLGKLQALAAPTKQLGVLVRKPAPGLTAEDRQRYAACERSLNHREEEYRRLRRQLDDTHAAQERHGADPPHRVDHSNQENRRLERELHETRVTLDEAQRRADSPSAPVAADFRQPFRLDIVDATLPARPCGTM